MQIPESCSYLRSLNLLVLLEIEATGSTSIHFSGAFAGRYKFCFRVKEIAVKSRISSQKEISCNRPGRRHCRPGTKQVRKNCGKDMNTHEYIQILRLHLLDMARVSQKSVDYAIKAYRLGHPELCTSVRACTYEIDVLHREITELVRDLLAMELFGELPLRYMLASERIANALRAVHSQAIEIATNSMRIFENGGGLGCTELATMGDLVNSLVRLSVVALFEEDLEHAEVVQRCSGVGRLFESTFYEWYRTVDHGARAQAEFERGITRHLRQIALQTYEISGAIVFWLEDSMDALTTDADKQTWESGETSTAESNQEVISIPDGMQAFLQTVDACLRTSAFGADFRRGV